MVIDGHPAIDGSFYTWATAGMLRFDVAFLLDRLSATMITDCFICLTDGAHLHRRLYGR